jgi:hypothetical protein
MVMDIAGATKNMTQDVERKFLEVLSKHADILENPKAFTSNLEKATDELREVTENIARAKAEIVRIKGNPHISITTINLRATIKSDYINGLSRRLGAAVNETRALVFDAEYLKHINASFGNSAELETAKSILNNLANLTSSTNILLNNTTGVAISALTTQLKELKATRLKLA